MKSNIIEGTVVGNIHDKERDAKIKEELRQAEVKKNAPQ
jgi:hypothetical protein